MIFALLLACTGEKPADDTSTTAGTDDTATVVDEDADGFPLGEDCDDTDRAVNPLADEKCNGVDDDCDQDIDEEAVDQGTWYADTDGDGYGNRDAEVHGCEQPDDSSGIPGDCDDTDPDAYPAAPEVPEDGVDQDCDGGDG